MSRHKMEVDLYKETRKGQTLLCMFSKPGIYHSGIILVSSVKLNSDNLTQASPDLKARVQLR